MDSRVTVRPSVIVNAAPATTFIYCCLCFSFAAMLLGVVNEGAALAVGVLQLSVFIGYTIGSVFILKSGSGIGGNTFFIFATIFGCTGGSLTIANEIAKAKGIAFSTQIASVIYIVSGLMLFVILYANRVSPKTDFFIILFAAIGVSSVGWSGFVLEELLTKVAGIALLIDGIIVFYTSSIGFIEMSGNKVNYGRPFVDKKSA
ncbi:hypothetical protein [Peptoniphilus catoniae]|uniref:hypothetical protein n=1 Tax=Peptoniphilus catoniae TaxID=1660341 RepID=UPI0010FF0A10|nr:hypothetical protein [Peptoniphilus catoniae]